MTRSTATTGDHTAADTVSTPPPEHDDRRAGRTIRLVVAAVTMSVLALTGASGAQAASLASRAGAPARTAATTGPQAANSVFGDLRVSRVVGRAANGARFVGRYHITRFVVRNQKVRAVGRLTGTLTRPNGASRDVSRRVRMPVNIPASAAANPVGPRLQGTAATAATAASAAGLLSCQVLNLVLGPLDLNLLGLVVHLNQVVLIITAVPGAGALLGNLLCAVAGLLDGAGLGGLNAILANLLNAILGILSA